MKQFSIFIISVIIFGVIQTAYAQTDEFNMDLEVSDEERIMIFAGFTIAVIAIFLFYQETLYLEKRHHMTKKILIQKKTRHMKNITLGGEMIMKN